MKTPPLSVVLIDRIYCWRTRNLHSPPSVRTTLPCRRWRHILYTLRQKRTSIQYCSRLWSKQHTEASP